MHVLLLHNAHQQIAEMSLCEAAFIWNQFTCKRKQRNLISQFCYFVFNFINCAALFSTLNRVTFFLLNSPPTNPVSHMTLLWSIWLGMDLFPISYLRVYSWIFQAHLIRASKHSINSECLSDGLIIISLSLLELAAFHLHHVETLGRLKWPH